MTATPGTGSQPPGSAGVNSAGNNSAGNATAGNNGPETARRRWPCSAG